MGTHATQLPVLSNLNSLTDHFGVAVTGAISHGTNETAFYLSTPNVSTGASFTIRILSELRKLYIKNNRKPLKKIYIEIDGASDNVAKAVVAAIEHLVLKNFCPLIILARLPVGHTHEDIDSRFGKIWTHMRSKHVKTFDEFYSTIKGAFAFKDNTTVQPVLQFLITRHTMINLWMSSNCVHDATPPAVLRWLEKLAAAKFRHGAIDMNWFSCILYIDNAF